MAVGAVTVGGVDEGGAGVQRGVQRTDAAVVVDLAVHAGREHHRAEADGRHPERAESAGRKRPRWLCLSMFDGSW